MKNVFIVMAVLVILVGGVLLWDSLRNNTINKTVINEIAEDLENDIAKFEEDLSVVTTDVDNANKESGGLDQKTDELFFDSEEMGFSINYPKTMFLKDYINERREINITNFETQEGYFKTGDVFLSIALLDGNYEEKYNRINKLYTDKNEGYEESKIVFNEDINLNGKSGKKVIFENNKPMEGSPYDSVVYYLLKENDKYYEIKLLKTQDSNDDLFVLGQNIIDSISWK